MASSGQNYCFHLVFKNLSKKYLEYLCVEVLSPPCTFFGGGR